MRSTPKRLGVMAAATAAAILSALLIVSTRDPTQVPPEPAFYQGPGGGTQESTGSALSGNEPSRVPSVASPTSAGAAQSIQEAKVATAAISGTWKPHASFPDGEQPHIWATHELGTQRDATILPGNTFAIEDLAPGRWTVSAGTALTYSEPVLVELLAGEERHIALTIHGSRPIRIFANTEDGEALLQAEPRAREFLVASALSDPPGEFLPGMTGSIRNPYGLGRFLPANGSTDTGLIGTVLLAHHDAAYVALTFRGVVLGAKHVNLETAELRFILPSADIKPTASVGLQVAKPNGTPCSGLAGRLEGQGVKPRFASSDSSGELRFVDLFPGEYTFVVVHPDVGHFVRNVRLGAGEHISLGSLRMGSFVEIRGQLLDPHGTPVQFEVGPSGVAANHHIELGAISTSPPGHVRFANRPLMAILGNGEYIVRVPQGQYTLRVDGETYGSLPIPVDALGTELSLDIPIKRLARVVLQLSMEREWRGCYLRVYAEGNKEMVARAISAASPIPLALPPGLTTVEISNTAGTTIVKTQIQVPDPIEDSPFIVHCN